MKHACQQLKEFIKDFRLTNRAGADCFEATIDFIVGGNNIKIKSEVHIVTSYPERGGTIYLLSRDISMTQLPNMFEAEREPFEYIPYERLRIAGVHHSAGDYIVFITPEKQPLNKPGTATELTPGQGQSA